MTELPNGWVETTFAEIATFNPKHSSELDRNKLVSFIPMPVVSEESGTIGPHEGRPLADVWKGYTHFADGDVIFAKITPCMENGKSAVARNLIGGLACGSTEFHVLRPKGGIVPEYLWGLLRQRSFREDAAQAMTGAVGQRRVPSDYLKSHSLSLPPLAEQRRIVAKLDQLMARTARARAELARIPALIAQHKRSLYVAAFSGQWAQSKWSWERADAVCDRVQSGGTPKEGFADGGIPFLKVYNIVDQRVNFAYRPQFVTNEVHNHALRKSIARPGDVLMNIVGPPLGKVAVVPDNYAEWNINQALTLFRPSERVASGWLYHFLCSGIPVRSVINETRGMVGQVNISLSQCRAFALPIPPPAEQNEIVRRIETAFAWLDKVAAEHAAATRLLDHLDQALLAKAFRGELVPQDPNDEPASELLARIRADRAAAAAPERKKRKVRA